MNKKGKIISFILGMLMMVSLSAHAYIYNPTNGGGGGGVTTLNTLSGAVTLSAGAGILLTPAGNNIAIGNTIPAQVNSDWTATSGVSQISNLLVQQSGNDSGTGTITANSTDVNWFDITAGGTAINSLSAFTQL